MNRNEFKKLINAEFPCFNWEFEVSKFTVIGTACYDDLDLRISWTSTGLDSGHFDIESVHVAYDGLDTIEEVKRLLVEGYTTHFEMCKSFLEAMKCPVQ